MRPPIYRRSLSISGSRESSQSKRRRMYSANVSPGLRYISRRSLSKAPLISCDSPIKALSSLSGRHYSALPALCEGYGSPNTLDCFKPLQCLFALRVTFVLICPPTRGAVPSRFVPHATAPRALAMLILRRTSLCRHTITAFLNTCSIRNMCLDRTWSSLHRLKLHCVHKSFHPFPIVLFAHRVIVRSHLRVTTCL